jgi:asparagine synthase (glutamine-hydrolysing)
MCGFEMEDAKKLLELLDSSVAESCVPETGIVFSSGIDSLIVAMLASKHAKVTAYTCGLPGAPDLLYAKACANLGFKLKVIDLTDEMIEEALPKIVAAIGDRNPVKVAVEVPFYFTSKKAKEDGFSVMLCGQGSDELFGGYSRYIDGLQENGYSGVADTMTFDIENIYPSQVDKDIVTCKANGIELRAPYLNKKFTEYARSLPIELKIAESDEYKCTDLACEKKYVRKFILRKVGELIGVPNEILHRSKKAAQYGSGTQKAVERIARSRGYREKAKAAGRTDYVKMFLEEL